MCGIAGMYLFKRGDLQQDYFSWCLHTMKRRGPDSKKIWHNNENYIAAFARLAIRDLSEQGDQPMLSECKKYCISFNGEIYNTKEIIGKLKPYRSFFSSTSDTEILLYALIHLGINTTLSLIDGMFAFAFFDANLNRLVLARDRVGIKPLYIGSSEKGIVYSSQYDHIINHSFFRNENMNESAIASYLSLGYMAENSGVINNTYLMPHGYYFIAENSKTSTHNYYTYPTYTASRKENFDDVLQQSVYEQLVSDVPVGTFMSGGTDSTLVSYFANRQKKLRSFTIGVEDKKMDEAKQAKTFASLFYTDHYCKYITSQDLIALIADNNNAFTEPFADYSSLPTLFLSGFAKEQITVALSGDGGDELFWGYPRNIRALDAMPLYKKNLNTRRLKLLTEKIRRPSSTDISRHWHHENFLEYYFSSLTITGALRWLPKICKAVPAAPFFFCKSSELYNEEMSIQETMNVIRKMEVDLHLQRILLKVDRASMYHSLEVRVPFLSNRMLDFSLFCNYKNCIVDNCGKVLVKKSLAAKTEKALVFRAKKGFTIPLDNWIRERIKKDVTEKIMNMPEHLAYFFRKNKLEQLLNEHMEKRVNAGWLIWALYSLVNWDATHRNKFESCE